MHRDGHFEFNADGTYDSNFAIGKWEVIDSKNLLLKNTQGVNYSLRFEDNFGEEAVLISPARIPKSRMRLKSETP